MDPNYIRRISLTLEIFATHNYVAFINILGTKIYYEHRGGCMTCLLRKFFETASSTTEVI
jgi:hypothetical protein